MIQNVLRRMLHEETFEPTKVKSIPIERIEISQFSSVYGRMSYVTAKFHFWVIHLNAVGQIPVKSCKMKQLLLAGNRFLV
jgi:hypothetical protein